MMTIFETLRETYSAEQVLAAFNIQPNSQHKILCPEHHETEPSCHVYQSSVYCFGCKHSWDIFALAQTLLEKRNKRSYAFDEVVAWFDKTTFKPRSETNYERSEYLGPVPRQYVDYWHDCLTDEYRQQIKQERKLTDATINQYKLGWRPDYAAFVIPFWRSEVGNSEVDIVQFRLLNGKPKYIGLGGHNRGSVMNAHLLENEQPYLVVLLGAFDAILALQDGLLAVGLNGSFPFKKSEKSRVQELFAEQSNIIIVPDNTTAEFKPAYHLAEWLNVTVKFFPNDLPSGVDYIDYRRLGYLPMDFKKDILQLNFPHAIIENITELFKVGDPFNLAWAHALVAAKQSSPQAVAEAVIQSGPLNYTDGQWQQACRPLAQVETEDDLYVCIQQTSRAIYELNGGW